LLGSLILGVGDDFFEGRPDEFLVVAHDLWGDLDGRGAVDHAATG